MYMQKFGVLKFGKFTFNDTCMYIHVCTYVHVDVQIMQTSLTIFLGMVSVSNCGFIPNASTISLILSALKSKNINVSPSKGVVSGRGLQSNLFHLLSVLQRPV